MLVLPDYITSIPSTPQIRYTWDNSDTQVVEGETDTELVERLEGVSLRANVALAAAVAEWIVGRLRIFPNLDLAYSYIEAAWATQIDLRYTRVVWEDYLSQDEWIDPVRGPIWLAMVRLQETIGSLVEGGDPEYTTSKLVAIALHLYADPTPFQTWFEAVVERLETLFPRTATDPLGDPVPRNLFNPSVEFTDDIDTSINRFLQSLAPDENPFLNTPVRMLEEGFPRRPYSFDLDEDRTRRA